MHPELELLLSSNNTEMIANLLLDYKLDVALVEGPVHHDHIAVRKWRDDELVVVAAGTHPLAKRKRLTTSDLQGEDWVVREPGSGTREVVEEALHERGLDWRHTLEMNSTAAIKQTVASSRVLAIVSLHAAADQIALGKLRVLRLSDLSIKRPLNYLTLEKRPLSLAARSFERFLSASNQSG